MTRFSLGTLTTLLALALVSFANESSADDSKKNRRGEGAAEQISPQELAPIVERFMPKNAYKSEDLTPPEQSDAPTEEIPDFQRHVSPLLGRLGCNGRACHGSFQGQGGFQLSLFGYDFGADHKALLERGASRVDEEDPQESLILTMPVDEDSHGGGKRFELGSWQYWVLRNWVEAGAKFDSEPVQKLDRLDVFPREIRFSSLGERTQLRVVASWEDGTIEDVTSLCRFHTNDAAIAAVDETGQVSSGEPGDTHVVVSYDNAVVPVQALRPVSEQYGDKYPTVATSTKIDELVVSKLRKLGVVPSELCTDEEFLRRASLDVTGTLPLPSEVLEFVKDASDDKRERKIEELLSRPAYAARWTTFFCDITGNNDDQLRNFLSFPQKMRAKGGATQWYQWIFKRVNENVPYDEMVEGIVTANSRETGETYREYCEAMSEICTDATGEMYADRSGLIHYWGRRDFASAEDRAIGFAHAFLGVRIQCAQCHKHPFDQWSKDDFDNFEKLFASVQARQNSLSADGKREYKKMVEKLSIEKGLKGNQLRTEFGKMLTSGKVVPYSELVITKPAASRGKAKRGAKPVPPRAKLLGGNWVELSGADPRTQLMEWLRAPENPYFAKAIANRIWAQYFEIGIVNPSDDINLANAPSNEPLLNYLAEGLRENGFDLKWLHRRILLSDTYQRSWKPNETNRSDKNNFSRSRLRRLPAESTYDAIRVALLNDDYVQKVHNLDAPRASLEAGSSARTLAANGDTNYALSVFGRSPRETTCDCDRSNDPSLLQTVFLLNDQSVRKWLCDPKSSWVSEVAQKYGWEKPTASPADDAKRKRIELQVQRFLKQTSVIDKQIAQAEQEGRTKSLVQMKARRTAAKDRAIEFAKQNGAHAYLRQLLREEDDGGPEDSEPMTTEQATWIAENAYLRSLTRQPTERELSIAVNFMQSEENPTQAVEGLLWSLVNTKEFILNH